MKTTVTEMKIYYQGSPAGSSMQKKVVLNFKIGEVSTIRNKKKNENLTVLWDTIRYANTYMWQVKKERKQSKGTERLSEEIWAHY